MSLCGPRDEKGSLNDELFRIISETSPLGGAQDSSKLVVFVLRLSELCRFLLF